MKLVVHLGYVRSEMVDSFTLEPHENVWDILGGIGGQFGKDFRWGFLTCHTEGFSYNSEPPMVKNDANNWILAEFVRYGDEWKVTGSSIK